MRPIVGGPRTSWRRPKYLMFRHRTRRGIESGAMDGKPCAGAILGLLLLAGSASAGPPMITDDPGTPAKGVWEENLALIVSDTRRQTVWATPSFDTNYNVTDHLQLNYTLPLEIVDNAGRGPVG